MSYCESPGCAGYGKPLVNGLCPTVPKAEPLPTILTDAEALEMIASALRAPEWDADTLEEVALAVRYTGRSTDTDEEES
jgi:hypothetical protein